MTAQTLSIRAVLRKCDGTRTLDYRSPIRHPAFRSTSRELLIENQEPWFQGPHCTSPDQHRPSENQQRRHKTVLPWSGKTEGKRNMKRRDFLKVGGVGLAASAVAAPAIAQTNPEIKWRLTA